MKKLRLLTFFLVVVCQSYLTYGQTTYTWIGASLDSWATTTSWSPTRTTPATDDIMVFNGGGAVIVTGVPIQTIGQLSVSNSSNITLQAAVTASTLTISGGAGTDLSVESGSQLNINTTNTLIINLPTTATGSVSGSMTLSAAAHRVTSTDASSLTFANGSVFTSGASFSGNAFGTTNLNSVIFASGSTYICIAGSNPFGASQPSSVVTFQTGSLFSLQGTVTPGFSGRTYANFEQNNAAVTTVTGGSAVSMDNLTITSGTLNFNMTATPGHSIKGNISIAPGATLNFSPASAGTVNFNGTSAQSINGLGTFSQGANSTFVINNSNGVTLNKSITLIAGLTLTTGNLITTSSNLLTLGSAATLTGGSASSFISGPLAHTWTTLTATKTYPLGKGSSYRPLIISLTTPTNPVISAEVFNSNAGGNQGSLNAISTVRYYQTALLSGTAASGGTVKITFGVDDDVSNNATLVVAKSTTVNGTYTSLGNSASDATSVTSSSYDPATGDFLLLGDTGTNLLPVELTSFTGILNKNVVNLHWTTATEINNQGFSLERSINKAGWVEIAFIKGAGNSNSTKEYRFNDADLTNTGQYQYRLKQVDNDGKITYNKAIEVIVNNLKTYGLAQNFPNPFNPVTTISYSIPEVSQVKLTIYNTIGQVVRVIENGVRAPGSYNITFDAAGLNSGIYFYKLEAGSYSQMNKMTLLK